MPSLRKLAIFGDSNLGAVRRAFDEGLVGFRGYDVEFWGAAGSEYRNIHYGKGALQAITPEAEETVLLVNRNGRKHLKTADFDTFVFYGVRLRLAEFFAGYLDLMLDSDRAISEAALGVAAAQFLQERRAVRMALLMREDGAKEIVFAYAGFPCWGVVNQQEEGRLLADVPRVVEALPEHRARLWGALERAFEELGFGFIGQPDETVVQGMFTDPVYAVEGAADKEDANHKSPRFAALLLKKRFD
ncbi:hypothetical protein [Lentibacter sp.]|uniref:hypothetical protein n=1 Tax=Lentibacter sp. TaxID=2024994 RepID=UPI003F697D32